MRGTETPGGAMERLYDQIDKLKAIILEMVRQVCTLITADRFFPWITEYIQLAFDDQMERIKELPEDEYIEAVATISLKTAEVGMTMAECANAMAGLADLAVADDEPRSQKPPRPAAVIGPRPRTTVPSRYLAQARRCKRLPRAGMKRP